MAVVIKNLAYGLFYVPDFMRYGSKPSRDMKHNPELNKSFIEHTRSYEECVSYAPHQVFIGNLNPDQLNDIEKPWYHHPLKEAKRRGLFGEIMPEDEFYAWMKIADDFDLLALELEFVTLIKEKVSSHRFMTDSRFEKIGNGKTEDEIKEKIKGQTAIPLYYKGSLIGCIRRDHDQDDTLKADVLLENLMTKASGTIAILELLDRAKFKGSNVDFVLDCTESAIGDRYNRGGGSLSKAMAEMAGLVNASGNDTRAFCCAPAHALINAAALVESGIFNSVIVAGGGCLAKLGMKAHAHLKHDMPLLEDVLGGMAFLITKDDGKSPIFRIDSIGKHDVGSGSPQQAIMTSLILKPLSKLGLKMTDIDKYSTELHNPEITLPAGSGDTPATNYRIIAALAVLNGDINKTEMDQFVQQRGMPGFVPTQGHIPSAVPFLGHAIKTMKKGKMKRAMFVAKGSLFLGRMSQLSDGMSFILEAND